jgi:glyoxylase-like metal-dependent hydrolase (beta-lactamase superfamily II)
MVNAMFGKFSLQLLIASGAFLILGFHSAHAHDGYPIVHRHVGGENDVLANAYLIETKKGVVAVDATMTVAESARLRADLLALHKPLLAVLLTHGHPDHYGGVTGLVAKDKVPVIATRTVDEVIRRDDQAKGQALKRAGIVWADVRTFPTQTIENGESVSFDGIQFTAYDAGPGESDADSYWIMESSPRVAFMGDIVVNHVHCFLSDGHSGLWLKKLDPLKSKLQTLGITTVYPGHGEPGGLDLIDWTRSYLATFRNAVSHLAAGHESLTPEQKAELSRQMSLFLPENRDPQFVTRSADPVAAELAKDPH